MGGGCARGQCPGERPCPHAVSAYTIHAIRAAWPHLDVDALGLLRPVVAHAMLLGILPVADLEFLRQQGGSDRDSTHEHSGVQAPCWVALRRGNGGLDSCGCRPWARRLDRLSRACGTCRPATMGAPSAGGILWGGCASTTYWLAAPLSCKGAAAEATAAEGASLRPHARGAHERGLGMREGGHTRGVGTLMTHLPTLARTCMLLSCTHWGEGG